MDIDPEILANLIFCIIILSLGITACHARHPDNRLRAHSLRHLLVRLPEICLIEPSPPPALSPAG